MRKGKHRGSTWKDHHCQANANSGGDVGMLQCNFNSLCMMPL